MTPKPAPPEDAGFALVAALLAVLLFSFFAYTVLASDRGAVAGLNAEAERARMEAAADAGLATVVAGLGGDGRGAPLNGRPTTFDLDGMEVTAAVEDNRGKVPANGLTADQVRRLLKAAGAPGRGLDGLVDNVVDWEGGGRQNGARALDYAAEGVRERAGPIRTLDELAMVHGMTPDLLARIEPALTVFPDVTARFDPADASRLAIAAFDEAGAAGAEAANHPAIAAETSSSLTGHPLTVRIAVRDAQGGAFQRTSVVEFTGAPRQPVWIRAIE